jgi:hypothetical protein
LSALRARSRGESKPIDSGEPHSTPMPQGSLPPLVREVIHSTLYARGSGYFNAAPVIASPPSPLRISRMVGAAEYRGAVAALYASSPGAWATPSELFAPHHARVVTRYMLSSSPPSAPLTVFEVGGGSGAHACAALDFLAADAPAAYATCSYTILEVSERLQAAQSAALAARGHARVARSVLADATAQLPPRLAHAGPCFVVALEVLDNLPHDKVARRRGDGAWCEVRVGAEIEGAKRDHRANAAAHGCGVPDATSGTSAQVARIRRPDVMAASLSVSACASSLARRPRTSPSASSRSRLMVHAVRIVAGT